MKKFLIILSVVFVIVVGALVTVPILFKDDIVAVLDKEIRKNVKAEVYFDVDNLSISLIRNFPNLTVTMEKFGVVGVEPFAGDTLVSVDAFNITVDIMSVISGDQIQLKAINLINPDIMVMVMEDGTANYDIAMDTGEEEIDTTTTDTGGDLRIAIDSWSIENGNIAYYDLSSDMLMAIEGLNHRGTGDFTLDVFDMTTATTINSMMFSMEDIEYLKNKTLKADIILNMDLTNSKFTFKENKIALNDFSFGFDGFFAMPADDYEMDITFEGRDNSVKSILSLVPGAFKEGYEDISASGDISFGGFVRGVYSETMNKMPAFNFKLVTSKGVIQYPDLPEAISNINIDLLVDNSDGIIENTEVALNQFHMEFGKNPVDASMKIRNLSDYSMVADINAELNLDDMMRIYPLEDTELSGMIKMDMHVDGVYDSINITIPASGNITINDLNFRSPDLPQGFGISQTTVAVNTERINISSFTGHVGNTDLNLSGYLSNYIAYAMKDELLTGEFNFRSRQVDLNEWMTEEDSVATADTDEADTSALEVIKVPENIDFVLRSDIEKVLYDDLELTNVTGNIFVRDGVVRLEDLEFKTLDGDFMMAGTYDTRDIEHPSFDFKFNIKNLGIPKAYQSFVAVQQFAPIARIMEGKFSTDFGMTGELQQDMMPDLNTLVGSGVLEILNASVKGEQSKVISGVTNLTKLSGESTNVTLNDVLMTAEISDGKVFVKPFEVNFGNQKAVIAGSNGLDGSLDYQIKLDVPPGAVQTATSLVSSAIGQNLNVDAKDIKLNLGVGGTYDDPQIKVLGAETGGGKQSAKQAMQATIDQEKEKVKKEAEKKIEEEKAKAQEKVEEEVEKKTEELLENADPELKEEVDKAKDKLKKFFKKKDG